MHGWAEVYLPGAGWVGFDPSWGLLADSNYFPVAVSRHSEHAPPISGTYFGTPRAFLRSDVDLFVKRIDEISPPCLNLEGERPVGTSLGDGAPLSPPDPLLVQTRFISDIKSSVQLQVASRDDAK